MLKGKGKTIGEKTNKLFFISLNPFALLNQFFNLSLILEISEIFADLMPVFSIYKTLLFCFINEVTSLCCVCQLVFQSIEPIIIMSLFLIII